MASNNKCIQCKDDMKEEVIFFQVSYVKISILTHAKSTQFLLFFSSVTKITYVVLNVKSMFLEVKYVQFASCVW